MASFLGGFICNRSTLVVLNVFYIIVAFILIGVAAYAKTFAFIVDYSIIGGILACGVILLLTALLGLFGTVLHHQVTLFVYMIILILLFIIQFSIACACLALNNSQQQYFFETAWKKSTWSMKYQMQEKFDCCGMNNDSLNDILLNENANGKGHPPCANSTLACANSSELCCTGIPNSGNATESCLQISCWDQITSGLSKAIRGVGAVGLFFSFVELAGVWLAYRYRNIKNPNVNPNAFL